MSPSRAPVLSFARYFQAPATQSRRRVTLQGAEVSSLRQSSQGRFGGGAGKEGARRLWFLINGESVSSHDHGFSNSLIIHIENTKEINV